MTLMRVTMIVCIFYVYLGLGMLVRGGGALFLLLKNELLQTDAGIEA